MYSKWITIPYLALYSIGVWLYMVWKGLTTFQPNMTRKAFYTFAFASILMFLVNWLNPTLNLKFEIGLAIACMLFVKYIIETICHGWQVFKSSGNIYLHLLANTYIVIMYLSYSVVTFFDVKFHMDAWLSSVLIGLIFVSMFYTRQNDAFKN